MANGKIKTKIVKIVMIDVRLVPKMPTIVILVKVSEHLFPNAHVQKVTMKMKTKLVKNVVVNVLNVKNPHPTVLYVQKKELKDLNQNVLAQQVNMKRTENVSNVTTNVIHV